MEKTRVVIGPDTNKDVIHNIYPDGLQLTPEQLNPHMGGWYKKCKHVYEYVNAPICPYCGKDTHENNWEINAMLVRDNYVNGNHEKHLCEKCGGTIRGWWDI